MKAPEDSLSYPNLNAHLTVDDAEKAIRFYTEAFGAEERFRLTDPETGKIGHAELLLQGALLMLADEHPEYNKSPKTLGSTSCKLNLMVPDTDAVAAQAVKVGAELIMPPTDMFYGFRTACLRDPLGHEWMVQHRIEDISVSEMQTRWEKMPKDCPQNWNS